MVPIGKVNNGKEYGSIYKRYIVDVITYNDTYVLCLKSKTTVPVEKVYNGKECRSIYKRCMVDVITHNITYVLSRFSPKTGVSRI